MGYGSDPPSDSWMRERSGVLECLDEHGKKLDVLGTKMDQVLDHTARLDERVKIHRTLFGVIGGIVGSVITWLGKAKFGG